MLALEITFLLGRYAAADFRDRERPEWPPHPARLYSALVAAAHGSGMGESAKAALLWLESLPPPLVCAEEAPGAQSPVIAYVPVNDPEDDLLPGRAERQPRSFPSVVPEAPPVVHFVWPDARPNEALTHLLGAVAANVTYLGSSRSPVHVQLTDRPPPASWFPDDSGAAVLRVPHQGRLETLDWHFQNGLRPPAGAFQRYRFGAGRPEAASPESVFGEMVVYRLTGPVDMEIETTLRLTEVLRAAAMRRAQETLGEVPEVLSGHDADGRPVRRNHAAYAALPFVSENQKHADGRLMGLAVVLPRDIAPEQRRRAVRPLTAIDHLTVSGVGRLGLERLTPDRPVPHNLRDKTWAGPSRHWASVTPVVLDRFPKRGGRGIEAIVASACSNVGLPRPEEVRADYHSRLHGVEPSFRFVTRRGGRDTNRLYTHVTLSFERPVVGPILLGAARHFGLGLLRPLVEGEP